MDEIIIIGIFALVFVGLPIGLGCLFYFVPKKIDYPKTGKYLTIIFGLLVLTFVLWTVFQDQFFSKYNAKERVEEQQILLVDKFSLKENRLTFAIGDYYHTFTLDISVKDKQNAILEIKSAKNFKSQTYQNKSLLYQHQDRYLRQKVIYNYETQNSYIREYFQPSGQEGYAPIFRRISISKTKNQLTFEDIDE